MVRQYATVVGAVLVLLGVVGFFVPGHLFGLINTDLVENIVHLVTGGLMLYVGLAQSDVSMARTVVGGLGVVYILVGVLSIISPTLFGLIPSGYTWADNVVHFALGILGVAVGYLMPRDPATTV